MTSVNDDSISYRTQWASRFIREELGRVQREAQVLVCFHSPFPTTTRLMLTSQPTNEADKFHLIPIPDVRDSTAKVNGFKIGIIGAGVAGLFTAMLFDFLNERYPGLNVDYQLIEAEPERYGGRLFTYTFPQKKGQPEIGPHDYYDVGAMRFPKVKTMDQ
jgi:hypothetical protein